MRHFWAIKPSIPSTQTPFDSARRSNPRRDGGSAREPPHLVHSSVLPLPHFEGRSAPCVHRAWNVRPGRTHLLEVRHSPSQARPPAHHPPEIIDHCTLDTVRFCQMAIKGMDEFQPVGRREAGREDERVGAFESGLWATDRYAASRAGPARHGAQGSKTGDRGVGTESTELNEPTGRLPRLTNPARSSASLWGDEHRSFLSAAGYSIPPALPSRYSSIWASCTLSTARPRPPPNFEH